nr:uncharacterized protein LOC128693555 isoform X1 [Cherax quadricarinatus]
MKASLLYFALITAVLHLCSAGSLIPEPCSIHLQNSGPPSTIALRFGGDYTINFSTYGYETDLQLIKTKHAITVNSLSANKTIFDELNPSNCSRQCTYMKFLFKGQTLEAKIWCNGWEVQFSNFYRLIKERNIILELSYVSGEVNICEGYEQYDPQKCVPMVQKYNTIQILILGVSSLMMLTVVCAGLYMGNHKYGWRVKLQRRTTWRLGRHSLLTLRFSASTTHTNEDSPVNMSTMISGNMSENRFAYRNAGVSTAPGGVSINTANYASEGSANLSNIVIPNVHQNTSASGRCLAKGVREKTPEDHNESGSVKRSPCKARGKTHQAKSLQEEDKSTSKSRLSQVNKLWRNGRSFSQSKSPAEIRSAHKTKLNTESRTTRKEVLSYPYKSPDEIKSSSSQGSMSSNMKPPAPLPKEHVQHKHTRSPVLEEQDHPYPRSQMSEEQDHPHTRRPVSEEQDHPHTRRPVSEEQDHPHTRRSVSEEQDHPYTRRPVSEQQDHPYTRSPVLEEQDHPHTRSPVLGEQDRPHTSRLVLGEQKNSIYGSIWQRNSVNTASPH